MPSSDFGTRTTTCPVQSAPQASVTGGHGAVREAGVRPQPLTGLPDPQDEAVRAPYHRHRPLLPQLLAGPLGGHVGGDSPGPALADQAQGAGRRDWRPVVALDAVAQLGARDGAVAGAVQVRQAVRPGRQRDRAQPGELRGRAGRFLRGPVRRLVPVQDRGRPPVEDPLHIGGRGVRGGPAAAAHQHGEQQYQADPARDARLRPATFPIVRRPGAGVRPA